MDAPIVLSQIVRLLYHVLDHAGQVSWSFPSFPWEFISVAQLVDFTSDINSAMVFLIANSCLSLQQ